MIYFVQAEGIGHIKIGFTDGEDVNGRIATLQTASPVRLRLLGAIPGGMEEEKDLHRRFAAARVQGEWFKPVAELLALIAPADALVCGKVEVVAQSVQIRVLTIGRKQFTKSLFDQLPTGDAIDWESARPDCDLVDRGAIWGWVTNSAGLWMVWESGGILRKCRFSEMVSVGKTREFKEEARAYDSTNTIGINSEKYGKIEMLYRKTWGKCYRRWMALGQLFIGV